LCGHKRVDFAQQENNCIDDVKSVENMVKL